MKGGVPQINKQLKLGMFIHLLSELARSLCCAKWCWKAWEDKLPSDIRYSLLLFQLQARNQLHTRVHFSALWLGPFLHLLFPQRANCCRTQAAAAGGTKSLHIPRTFPYNSEWVHWSVTANLNKIAFVETRKLIYTKSLYYEDADKVKQDEFNSVQELLHDCETPFLCTSDFYKHFLSFKLRCGITSKQDMQFSIS